MRGQLTGAVEDAAADDVLAAAEHAAAVLELDAHFLCCGVRLHLHRASMLDVDLAEDEVVDRRRHLVPCQRLAVVELDLQHTVPTDTRASPGTPMHNARQAVLE